MTYVEQVRQMIRAYPVNLAQMRKLEQEMERFIPITANEVLDMLTFPGKSEDYTRVQKDRSKDHTFHVAVSYRRFTWLLNHDVESEMIKEYGTAAREIEFIRYAVRALPKFYREIMTFDVLENHCWGEVCQKFKISGGKLSRKKARATELMAKTFKKQYVYFGFRKEDLYGNDTGAV